MSPWCCEWRAAERARSRRRGRGGVGRSVGEGFFELAVGTPSLGRSVRNLLPHPPPPGPCSQQLGGELNIVPPGGKAGEGFAGEEVLTDAGGVPCRQRLHLGVGSLPPWEPPRDHVPKRSWCPAGHRTPCLAARGCAGVGDHPAGCHRLRDETPRVHSPQGNRTVALHRRVATTVAPSSVDAGRTRAGVTCPPSPCLFPGGTGSLHGLEGRCGTRWSREVGECRTRCSWSSLARQ